MDANSRQNKADYSAMGQSFVACYPSAVITGIFYRLMPCEGYNFQIDFDFTDHHLKVSTTKGEQRKFSLQSISVADFYHKIFRLLEELKHSHKNKPSIC